MEWVVVRALSSHQCDPDSNPGVDATVVFLRVLRSSSLLKIQHFQIPIRPPCGWATSKNISYLSNRFLLFIIYLLTNYLITEAVGQSVALYSELGWNFYCF